MKRKLPNIVTLAFLTTITIIIWIGYSIYDAYIKSPNIKIDEAILKDINPTLNSNVLAEVAKKVYFEKGETTAFPEESLSPLNETEIENITPTEVATDEASPESNESEQDESISP